MSHPGEQIEHAANTELLTESIAQIRSGAQSLHAKLLIEKADALSTKLQTLSFNLVIVGEFKRGKSTLINALLGAKVLPTASIPLTSVTTINKYGDAPGIRVHFMDGSEKISSIQDLETFVTERLNPKNKLEVDCVEVFYPSPVLQLGAQIVDTPGTGSVYSHNTDTTYGFLPNADAIIFVFLADQPTARAELDLLKHASASSAAVFLVLNKIDNLDEESLPEALNFVRETIANETGNTSELYPLSAKKALAAALAGSSDEQFSKFSEALTRFLQTKRMDTFENSMKLKLLTLIDEISQLLELERTSLNMSKEDLQKSLKTFETSSKEILSQSADAEDILRGEIARLIRNIEEELKPVVEANQTFVEGEIETAFEQNKSLPKDDLIGVMKNALKAKIHHVFEEWRKIEEAELHDKFIALNGRFVKRANELMNQIHADAKNSFNLDIETSFELEHLTHKTRLYYSVEDPFTLSLQMLPLMLPDFAAKPIIHDRFVEAARSELQKNAGRIRADFQERLEESSRQFLIKFQNKIRDLQGQIRGTAERALSIMNEGNMERDARLSELKDLSAQLHSIKQSLSAT